MDLALDLRLGRSIEVVACVVLLFVFWPVLVLATCATYVPGQPLLMRRNARTASGEPVVLYSLNLPDVRERGAVHRLLYLSRADLMPRLINVMRGDVALWSSDGRAGFLDGEDVHHA